MATKEQERKALEQIKKIIEGLGKDSYIAIAMDGMIEDAEENIQNDWGCSMKDRWQTAEQACDLRREEVAKLQEQNKKLEAAVNLRNMELDSKQTDIDNLIIYKNEYKESMNKEYSARIEAENKVAELEGEIIKLKAKLYDLITK